MIANDRTRVIDASTAHRVAPGWVYGFPEVAGPAAGAGAQCVSIPGVYSSGFIAVVGPLVRAGLLTADWPYSCNSVSGYSGGGKALIERFEADRDIAWRGYALALDHKHVPEMQDRCGLTIAPLFSPAVVPAHRGMVVEVPLPLAAMPGRSEEHTSEPQSLMRLSYTVFCLQKKNTNEQTLRKTIIHKNTKPPDSQAEKQAVTIQ